MSLRAKAKAAQPYLAGAAKISLEALKELADVIPVPFIQTFVASACKVIRIVETVKSNVEGASELIERTNSITLVIVTSDSIRDKAERDILDDVKLHVNELSRIMDTIEHDVRAIHKRLGRIRLLVLVKAILLYKDNEKKISDCSKRLDWALDVFNVAAHIDSARELAHVSRNVVAIRTDLRAMGQKIDMMAITKTQAGSLVATTSALPPRPEIFFGRDDVVAELSIRGIQTEGARFAILGPGGMGKTTLVSAFLWRPEVISHFGSRRHWVRCEEATSVALLIAIAAAALGIEKSTDGLQDITTFLQSESRPRLLILDNFETPWDLTNFQSQVLDVLCTLSSFSHLTIILTMRGTLPGISRVRWTKPILPPLETLTLESARTLFLEMNPDTISDPHLDTLLEELGYLPLAVTLMAKVGADGLTPSTLLELWRAKGVAAVDEPNGDRLTSLDRSIRLSLESNMMKNRPESLRLLSLISYFPAGVRIEVLSKLAPTLANIEQAILALRRTSLIYVSNEEASYRGLPPIQSYIRQQQPITDDVFKDVLDYYCWFTQEHSFQVGAPDASAHIQALSAEELNIEAVLLRALTEQPSHPVLDASHTLSYYLYYARPRLPVSEAAVQASRRIRDRYQLCRSLRLLGMLQQKVGDCLTDALTSYEEALNLSRELGDSSMTAFLLRDLGIFHYGRVSFTQARAYFEEAFKKFGAAGDTLHQMDCLSKMCRVHIALAQYDQARHIIEKAMAGFQISGKLYDVVQCELLLARMLTYQSRYFEAGELLSSAQEKAETIGDIDLPPWIRLDVCRVDTLQGVYARAEEPCQEVLNAFEKRRHRLGVACSNLILGEIYWRTGRTNAARTVLNKAMESFSGLIRPLEMAECRRSIGEVDKLDGRLAEARQGLERSCEELRQLGTPYWLAQSLESLAQLELEEGRDEEAAATLQEALQMWNKVGNSEAIQRCKALIQTTRKGTQ